MSGDDGTGILNINEGTAVLGNIILYVANGSTGTVNVNGGVLNVAVIASDASAGSSSSPINFNGGTVQAFFGCRVLNGKRRNYTRLQAGQARERNSSVSGSRI